MNTLKSIANKTLSAFVILFLLITGITIADKKTVHAENIDLPKTLNHVCAGKRLTYRKHVDAAYLQQVTPNNIDIKVVDGRTVRDANTVCVRLAPDANGDGDEVSRLAIPADRQLAFLGKPGDVVWSAPQEFYKGWAPVWAGIGALEQEHEEHPLGDIVSESVKMDLVEVDGPGDVEMFTYNGKYRPVTRIISSKDSRYKRNYMTAGMHTHSFTTFTKPGVYRLKWQGHVTLTNGKEIATPKREVIWLVGTDEQVGLPSGTTKGTKQIQTPTETFAENIKKELSEDNSSYDPKYSNDDYEPLLPEDWGTDYYEDIKHIAKGHLDIKAKWQAGEKSVEVVLKDESDPANVVERETETVAIEVPDSSLFLPKGNSPGYKKLRELSDRKDTRLYELPELQNQNLPWLGFNTEDIDYENINGAVNIKATKSGGPGRMITGTYNALQNDFIKGIDTAYSSTMYEKLANPTHVHKATYFTQPGIYEVYYQFIFQPKNQERKVYGDFVIYYLVGDKSINASRKAYGLPLLDNKNSEETNTNTQEEKTKLDNLLGIYKENNSLYYTYGEGETIHTNYDLKEINNYIVEKDYIDNMKPENVIGVTDDEFYYLDKDNNKIYKVQDIPDYEEGEGIENPAQVIGIVSDGYYYISDAKLYKYEGDDKPANIGNKKYGQYWKLDKIINKYVRLSLEEIQSSTDQKDNTGQNPKDNDQTGENNDDQNTDDQNSSGNNENTDNNTSSNDNADTNSQNQNHQGQNDQNENSQETNDSDTTNTQESNNNTQDKDNVNNDSKENSENNIQDTNQNNHQNNNTHQLNKKINEEYKEITQNEYDRINGVEQGTNNVNANEQNISRPFLGNATNVNITSKDQASEENDDQTSVNAGMVPISKLNANKNNVSIQNSTSLLPMIAAGIFGAGLMLMVSALLFLLYTQKMSKSKT